jgi:hypothetical protein
MKIAARFAFAATSTSVAAAASELPPTLRSPDPHLLPFPMVGASP